VGYDLVTGRGTPYADRIVRDLVGVTPNKTASAVRPSGATSTVKARTAASRFDAFAITGDSRLLGIGGSEQLPVPAPQTPRAVSDIVWLGEHARTPLTPTPIRDAALLDVAAGMGLDSPSALYWNADDGLSLGGAGEM
jgi:hypothetical protein